MTQDQVQSGSKSGHYQIVYQLVLKWVLFVGLEMGHYAMVCQLVVKWVLIVGL